MPMPQPLSRQSDLVLSHMGFYVKNLEAMGQFYKDILGFIETDRGDLGAVQLMFLSRDPNEHHQLVLSSGRPGDLAFNVINQLSFRVQNLATLTFVHKSALATEGVHDMQCATHGNAISIYFRDPEGNRIEVFLDTPWYCEQPLREPIDLTQNDDVIMDLAHSIAKTRPKYQAREQWQAEMAKRMGYLTQ